MATIFRLKGVRPLAFFAGLLCGLIALSVIGRSLAHRGFAENFIRFNFFLGIETNFFPTALQLRAILLTREPSRDVVHVVVGGSSVFNGVGQHATRLWTRRLQEILGPHFLVTNVATRAGSPFDYGLVAMNILLHEGRRAIYVADGAPGQFGSDLRASQYTYLTYDAASRGLLLPWEPRDRLLAELAGGALMERRLGAALNSWLNFDDLWNYLRYQHFSTIYSRLIGADRVFRPLRSLGDPEPLPEQVAQLAYTVPFEPSMQVMRAFAQPLPDAVFDQITRAIETMTPPEVRERSLAVILMNSPYYADHLSAEDRAQYERTAAATVAAIAHAGLEALLVGAPLEAQDYIDRTHLAVTGGDKLAPIVAARVRALAARLGYAE
jgi:hypothetical protein